ncbi:MAG: hypothetical protein LLF90_02585 [Methanomicrobiaceae archaeon]|uniref:hypothetical protein n=1 Tax=Methanoculleus sp. TaxID=90427 RepID=UPI0032100D56|nr:hypothetical protein [Methanomicrobiaceae archaeon]
MEFGRRIVLAVGVLVVVVAVSFLVDTAVRGAYLQNNDPAAPLLHTATVDWEDFRHGPQSWRPYATPVAIGPGDLPSGGWYLAFVELGAVPVAGNPALSRTGSVRVDYRFTDLAGTASFSVYGLRAGDGRTWTNRQSGYGTSGYHVSGTAAPGEPPRWASPLLQGDRYTIETAGSSHPVDDDVVRDTRTFWFERTGSGLDGLHITTDPAARKGQVTETADLEGSFYVTYTGGNVVGDLFLMIAVDRPQPEGFELILESTFVEGRR